MNKGSIKNILVCYSQAKVHNDEFIIQFLSDLKKVFVDSYIDLQSVETSYKIGVFSYSGDGNQNILYDIAFSIGGDGTFLRTLHLLQNMDTPVIGINFGRRGFLTEIKKDDYKKALKELSKGEYFVKEYSYLKGVIGKESAFAVNDIFVGKTDFLKTIHLALYIDNSFVEEYICDGLLISSPLGSTAYNRALGGPVVYPDSKVNIIMPIGTSDSYFKSLVVPSNSEIEVKFLHHGSSSNIVVGFDGTQKVINQGMSESVKISVSNNLYRLIKLNSYDYFKNTSEKLKAGLNEN